MLAAWSNSANDNQVMMRAHRRPSSVDRGRSPLGPRPAFTRFPTKLSTILILSWVGCSGPDPESLREHETPEQVGVLTDSVTGLMWQDPLFVERRSWFDAQAACEALVLAGYDDWRLPTISELRSLARGCAATVAGGACGVTDDCQENACFAPSCNGCAEYGGPSPDGCYRPADFTGDCMTTWTSSVPPDLPERAWTVGFAGCHVLTYPKSEAKINTRCVR